MANIIEITDFNSPQLDIYARMSEGHLLNRHEPEKGIFIAESPKVVERALDAGCEPISMLVEHKHIDGEAKPIIDRCGEVPVYTAPFEVLTRLTGFKLTRGMLCAMHRPQLPNVSEVCSKARRIAVLENVMNPTTIVNIEEGGYMEMETVQIKGIDSTNRITEAKLDKDAKIVITERIMTHGNQFAETHFNVDMNGDGSSANVISRSVAKGNSKQAFYSVINGNAKCTGHS